MKLIDETKWHNQALNFKKLIEVYKSLKTAFDILKHKGSSDPKLKNN